MRVFVTGATGLIGFAVVRELLEAGHQVTGLARNAAAARKLADAGAQVAPGALEDLASLRRAAAGADGAIHTAYYHQLSQMPLATRLRVFLGGAPSQAFLRFMRAAAAADRKAIDAIGGALKDGSPLVAAFGTLGMKPGRLATEDQAYDHDASATRIGRGRTEDALKAMVAARGIRTSAIRLPPIVHGPDRFGLAMRLIPDARKKKTSAYVADGLNRWPSVHHVDAAHLFRLALENGPAGGTYHGVDEEGIPFREIAEVIGRRLKVPVIGVSASQAAKQFGFLAGIVQVDNPTSNRLTRERLGWRPTNPGLIMELERTRFFSTRQA